MAGDDEKPMDATNSGATQNESTRATTQIESATAVQLQPFWTSNPKTWFQLAELQFDAARVPAITRYTKTLAALPIELCDRIPDILADPPKTNQYITLRDRLIERLAVSDERQLETLLAGEELGDRKPSEILGRIQTLAGTNFSEKIIKTLWIRRLPPLIRLAIVGQDPRTSIADSARSADKMYEILPASSINETTRPSRSTTRSNRIVYRSNHDGNRNSPASSVENRLARIEAQLKRMFSPRQSRSRERRYSSQTRSKTFSNDRSRGRSSSRGPTNDVCWFHERFGNRARRCREPCQFGQSTSATVMDINDTIPKNI